MRLFALICLLVFPGIAISQNCRVSVSVAISLKEVVAKLAEDFSACKVSVNFGGSHALAKQIAAGAAIDVFIPASDNVSPLLGDRKIWAKVVVAQNQLVAISRSQISDLPNLVKSSRKIAIGQPSLPAGYYAHQALELSVGLDSKVTNKFVFGDNVRAVANLVFRGAADSGFVYLTDLLHVDSTKFMKLPLPEVKVLYPAFLLTDDEPGRKFLEYLGSPRAKAIFLAHNFIAR